MSICSHTHVQEYISSTCRLPSTFGHLDSSFGLCMVIIASKFIVIHSSLGKCEMLSCHVVLDSLLDKLSAYFRHEDEISSAVRSLDRLPCTLPYILVGGPFKFAHVILWSCWALDHVACPPSRSLLALFNKELLADAQWETWCLVMWSQLQFAACEGRT